MEYAKKKVPTEVRTLLVRRGGRIRTYDLLLPKQARYRATLHPERLGCAKIKKNQKSQPFSTNFFIRSKTVDGFKYCMHDLPWEQVPA